MAPSTIALTIGRVHSEIDRYVGYTLVASRYPIRLRLDLLSHLVEIDEFLALALQKLRKLCETRRRRRSITSCILENNLFEEEYFTQFIYFLFEDVLPTHTHTTPPYRKIFFDPGSTMQEAQR